MESANTAYHVNEIQSLLEKLVNKLEKIENHLKKIEETVTKQQNIEDNMK